MPQQRVTFALGFLVATPGVLDALSNTGEEALPYLTRFAKGDWGDMSESDREANDEALRAGERLFGAYKLRDNQTVIWIITEADRSATTLLLPEEY